MRRAAKQQLTESHYTCNRLDGKLGYSEYQTLETAHIH